MSVRSGRIEGGKDGMGGVDIAARGSVGVEGRGRGEDANMEPESVGEGGTSAAGGVEEALVPIGGLRGEVDVEVSSSEVEGVVGSALEGVMECEVVG